MLTESVCSHICVFVQTLEHGNCFVDRPGMRPYSGRMRWDALFNDMESQMAESDRLSLDAEVNERAKVEEVELGLADRLRSALGCLVTVHLSGGETLHGTLAHAGADALVLHDDPHQILVPYAAAARYVGLGRFSRSEPSKVRRGLGLAHSLRALARDRAVLTVTLGYGAGPVRLEGVIDRVGRDYFDLAAVVPGEPRRSVHVTGVSSIPFAALAAIRSPLVRDM